MNHIGAQEVPAGSVPPVAPRGSPGEFARHTDSDNTNDLSEAQDRTVLPMAAPSSSGGPTHYENPNGIDWRPEGVPTPEFTPPPPKRLDGSAHLDMDYGNIEHLFEALVRHDPVHGTVMQALEGEHMYNWLDAAPPAWLAEHIDNIILTCARKMAVRHAGLLESEFTDNGYVQGGHVTRGLALKYHIKEYEKHKAFYLKTKERLERLDRLDSINRRSRLAVIKFPAKAAGDNLGFGSADCSAETTPSGRDLAATYEQRRRAKLTEGSRIVNGRGDLFPPDWLDRATPAELEESTDTIMFACAARMAIRMCLRLEKAWHQSTSVDNDAAIFKTDILDDLRKERDEAVDSYLKLREAQAKAEHNQGIVARSDSGSTLRKPRRPRMRTKKIATA